MLDDVVRIAIIGCGWAGIRHAAAFRAEGGVEITWAIDTDESRARSLQAEWPEVRIAADYREPLADPELDAVDICLPHNLHAPVAIDAANAGKHILCEKPLAATLDQADQMIEAADAASVVFMVAENVRYELVYLAVRDLLEDGVIGKPALIQMTREAYLRQSFIEDRPWFLNAESAAGGIMMSGGIHDFETMRMLIGDVESIHALRARQRFTEMEGDDTSTAMLRFTDGTVGMLVESFIVKSLTTASGPEVHTLRIDGDLGSLSTSDGQTITVFSEREDYLPGGQPREHRIHVPPQNSFQLQIAHFLESIRTGTEPITSGRSQRRALEIVLAAYRSIETGQPVRV
jgi:UDP-N-acetyl-2-amino-2-deoxyglucuronate dehydrogenase